MAEIESSKEVESSTSKKRALPSENNEINVETKKVKVAFSAKEFRKTLLNTTERGAALQNFLQLLNEESKHQYVLSYLDKGGNILEILQIMENEQTVSPVLVFEIVNHILLQIQAKHAQYQTVAYDACRYLLNTYIVLINKMISLSSSTKERLVTLKLLTTIVTSSAVLAKDILLHVNFNAQNLELLTKVAENKIEVRNAFVFFIAAFLVDGHFPTLSVLLEKKGLLTSIISGLKFDKVETVVLVLTAMKNHILENPSVSKTIKMKTFSTNVLRDIVNLYNWKGPSAIHDPKKKSTKVFQVDEIGKSKVSEAVHAFLLVMCTSHKFGVIFRDPSVGLNKKNQNALMYTVLESLERPWEHSYAGELVSKICGACPDLTKTMWTNLKPFLEPRQTVKWMNAMRFAEKLIDQFRPEAIDLFVKDLNAQQVAQIIVNLTAPLSVIKVLLPGEGHIFDKQSIKLNILQLFMKMATAVETSLEQSKCWPGLDQRLLSATLSNYLMRNFPDSKFIFDDWERVDDSSETGDEQSPVLKYLNIAFDLMSRYKRLAPSMLDAIGPVYDIKEFILKTEQIENVDRLELRKLQVKAVKFLIDLEPSLFTIKNELFQIVLNFSMEFYHETRDVFALEVLSVLLNKTGIFDTYPMEVYVWIDGIFNTSVFDHVIVNFFNDLLQLIDEHTSDYHNKLYQLKNNNFSALTLALIDSSRINQFNKSIKTYLNFVLLNLFHLQHDSTCFREQFVEFNGISNNLKSYIENWGSLTAVPLSKCKGNILIHFQEFSRQFLEEKIEHFDFNAYPTLKLNLSQAAMFYFTNLIKAGSVEARHSENLTNIVKILINDGFFVDGNYLKIFLGHPLILEKFTLFNVDDPATNFILTIMKLLKNGNFHIDSYVTEYRTRIVSILEKVFKHPQKYENKTITIDIIETFDLSYEQCTKLVEKFENSTQNRRFFKVATYCLQRMASLASENYSLSPLSNDTIGILSKIFVQLIDEQSSGIHTFSSALLSYLKTFPHNTGEIDVAVFEKLVKMPEYNKDNVLLCEFLLDRKKEVFACFVENLAEIGAKKSFILPLLEVVIAKNDEDVLKKVFACVEPHIAKAMSKPHKAGQHFQAHYKTVGVLVAQFMEAKNFGNQIQKFETTELFHVYLLKILFGKVEKTEKKLTNMVMTFVHLLVSALKQLNKQEENVDGLCEIFASFLGEIHSDLTALNSNETLKMFSKLCLKFGIGSGHKVLLTILAKIIEVCFDGHESKLVLEMMLSHSQFLDLVLGDCNKAELLNLWLVICKKFPELMEKSHVPVLLSAYRATKQEHDRITLNLLKLYESQPEQTQFFAFKPFLWGRSAASYYSVRSDIQKVLWRQPKMGDLLDNLQHSTILQTITDPAAEDSYDLDFFLPLFCHLLSPENPVHTYRFTKSGALALTLTALRGPNQQRLAGCQVLSRFYFHLEARHSGKDTVLWLRFIEAVSIGLAGVPDNKLNNFSTIYLALSALVLTQPDHVMYLPLTQYLVAKDSLDFGTIPELYTFLHSSDVNSKDHRLFILDVIRNGLKDEKDFASLLRSMGVKLLSELCSSSLSDYDTKLIILDIFKACCDLPFGLKVLCGSLSFLSQITNMLFTHLNSKEINDKFILKLLQILRIILNSSDVNLHKYFIVYVNLIIMLEVEHFSKFSAEILDILYELFCLVVRHQPELFQVQHSNLILNKSKDQFCNYIVQNGCDFLKESDCKSFLHTLFFIKQTNK